MPDYDQRRTAGAEGRAPAQGYTGRARKSFEVEEFEPAGTPRPARPLGTAQPRPATAQPRPATAQPRQATTQARPTTAQPRPATAQPRQATAQPRQATAQPRQATAQPRQATAQPRQATAQPRPVGTAQPRPAEAQARAPRPVSRPAEDRPASGEYEARYGAARRESPRAESEPIRRRRGNPFAAMPQWARLGVVALVFMALIAAVGRIITTSGTQQDRTVIRPMVLNSEEPSPTDGAQQVASNNATSGEPSGAPANPVEATATPDPGDWNISLATGSPVSIPDGNLRRATIRMAGDVIVDAEMLQGSYDKSSDTYDFSPYFELIGDTLSRSDYTMINIEASLRKGKYGYSGYPQFTTPPVILQVLKRVGCDMITMCNNHMLDGFCDGLVESVGHVNDAGLDHIGGFVDEPDSTSPEIYEIGGIKVGFVTYTQTTNSVEQSCDNRYKFLVHYLKNAKFADDVAKARAAGAEVVVAVTHWGEEYKRSPESSTASYARQLVAAGADLIIGGHPHMVQPAEYITATDAGGRSRTALCVYSLGNFLSQHVMKYTDSGIVFEFTIQENTDGSFSIVNPGYVPVFVWKWPVLDENGHTVKSTAKNRSDYIVYDLRVMPIAPYMENPPEGMDTEQYNRMRECWMETLEVMGNNSVLQVLAE